MNTPQSNREYKGIAGGEKESDPDRSQGIDPSAGPEQDRTPDDAGARKRYDAGAASVPAGDDVTDPGDVGTHGSPRSDRNNGSHPTHGASHGPSHNPTNRAHDRSDDGGRHEPRLAAPAISPCPAGRESVARMAKATFSDEQLLEAYRRGDTSAFTHLVERYQRELFHFLVRFLGDRAAAEDVFQETFLQVHQSAETFDPQRRFRPWLFTIAANKARDLMRSQARRPTNPLMASISPGDEDSGQFIDLMESAVNLPSASLEKHELQVLVHGTVLGMPEHLREILLLSYFHQFPYKQISDILNIPLGTVKSRLHAAVAYFADRWRQNGENKSTSH